MAFQLVPRETKFFDMFGEMAKNLTRGAHKMVDLLADYRDVEARVSEIKQIEHEGDDMTHAVITKLNQTFITPFDREDIHRLAATLDDVLDLLNAAAERLMIYKISGVPGTAHDLARVVVAQCREIELAMPLLEKDNQRVMPHCIEINRLEDEADNITRRAIAALFEREKDPIQLIKIKELYEVLERATDKAEDVANVLESIVVKSA